MKWSNFAKPVRPNAVLFGVGAVIIIVLMLRYGFEFLGGLLEEENKQWITGAAVGSIWTAFVMLVTVIVSGYGNTMIQLVTDPPEKEEGTVPAGTHERIVDRVSPEIDLNAAEEAEPTKPV